MMGSLRLFESGVFVHYFSCFWTSSSHQHQQARPCWRLSFLLQLGGICLCCCLMDCFLALLSHWPHPREDAYGDVAANERSPETLFHTLCTSSSQAALSPIKWHSSQGEKGQQLLWKQRLLASAEEERQGLATSRILNCQGLSTWSV